MKKLMFVAAVAAAMTGLADVTSANIVGYQNVQNLRTTSTAELNPNMIGIPFAGLEEGKGMPVSDLVIKGFAGSDYTETDCDYIEIWDKAAGSADVYYYDTDDDAWECSANAYSHLEDDYADGIAPGTAMWYTACTAGDRGGEELSITLAGAVDNQPSVSFFPRSTSGAELTPTMLSNPFPVAWMVTDSEEVVDGKPAPCVITGFAGSDYNEEDCDYIEIWNNKDGSASVYYYDTDDDAWECSANAYSKIQDDFEDGIPAGNAFWYTAASVSHTMGDIEIKFINPIKK